MVSLHSIIASEKHVKSRAHSVISELYKLIQKPILFSGQVRTYQKKDDAGEDLPSEKQNIQVFLEDVLVAFRHECGSTIDITAQKDIGNQSAKAAVIVDGIEVLPELPVTTLLFLEKQLTDMRTFLAAVPDLDGSETWQIDPQDGLYKSGVSRTHRTKKNQKAIVLYDATDKHPAQTQLITEDEVVGYWDTRKMSTAMPKTKKVQLLAKVDALLHGVKEARERANDSTVEMKPQISAKIFAYIFGDTK